MLISIIQPSATATTRSEYHLHDRTQQELTHGTIERERGTNWNELAARNEIRKMSAFTCRLRSYLPLDDLLSVRYWVYVCVCVCLTNSQAETWCAIFSLQKRKKKKNPDTRIVNEAKRDSTTMYRKNETGKGLSFFVHRLHFMKGTQCVVCLNGSHHRHARSLRCNYLKFCAANSFAAENNLFFTCIPPLSAMTLNHFNDPILAVAL